MKTVALSAALYAALSVAAPVPAAAAGDCKSFVLLFARGTTEMGTMGSVVGPSLSTKVKSALGENNVNVEGVNYAADAGGIMTESMGTGGAGTTAMTNQANSWLTKCPDTKLILTGYSQGAMLVHHTTTKLGSKASKVAAAVTFGDPFKAQKLDGVDPSKFKTYCASGDSVCGLGSGSGGTGGTASQSASGHLGYGADTTSAANFIKSAVGSSSQRQLTGTSTTDGGLGGLIPSSGSSLGSGTSSGFGGLESLIPSGGSGTGMSSGLGSLSSGSGSLGGFGSNVGASALAARDAQLGGGLSGGSLPSDLPSLGSGTGSGSGLGSGSLPSGLPTGLGSGTGSSLGGLASGLPSLDGSSSSSSSSSGTSTLEARAPQFDLGSLTGGTGTGSSFGGLSTPSFGSLGGGSTGSGTSPFGSLSSLGSGSLGSLGSSSGLGSSGLSSGL
ncbi:cutinase-domain-containing protein [Phyllosticta citriasiana]|uniref:cutinase n=1 Tax=Phyllosticta citriasiana TaxID=595635 RepID=A0ABR1KNG1_9PEZI